MSATQDYVALEWIRGELSNTLQQAQVALEAVAESSDDASSMRACLTSIHQVHGTLKMVQLEGPTQLAAEMEQVAQSLMNSSVPDVPSAQETLMQAILQLPAYLDRLHRERQDSERNYMPIVNNLRLARGEERIAYAGEAGGGEGGSAGPDLGPLTDAPADDVVQAYVAGKGEENLPKIRARFGQTFSAILKKNNVRENLTTLVKLFAMVEKLCGNSPMGNLSQIVMAVIEGIAGGAIKLDNQSAGLLRKMDAQLKALAEAGSAGLATPVDEEYALALIELVNNAAKETARITAVREKYAATTVDAEPEDVAVGPDDETIAAVARILIEELNSVTDKLDLYVRASTRNPDDLVDLLPNLEQIASTMVVLGNSEHQQTVTAQIAVIKEIESSGTADEEQLLQMAQSLLQIEASLGAMVGDGEDGAEADNFGNLDEAQAAVVRESRTGLANCKDAVIDFISSNFDHSKLESLPGELLALRGGLMIVNQSRAGDVLEAAANYVNHALLASSANPELEQMDDLADAITSVEYYLERLLENAGDPYLQMLEVAESAVEKLGYPVGFKPEEAAAETAPEVEEAAVEAEEISDEVEEMELESEAPAAEEIAAAEETVAAEEATVEEEPAAQEEAAVVEEPLAEEAPAAEPAAVEAEAPAEDEDDDLIDDEILEIFVDEAEEVLETIAEFLPQWQSDVNDNEALTEVRRAFHTLKGSGRMVGATVVGELAWSIENMLNRVMDNTIEASPEVVEIVAEVVQKIPEGVKAFQEGQQSTFETAAMAATADALAEGKAAPVQESPAPEITEEDVTLDEVDLDDLTAPVADESPAVEETPVVEEAPVVEEVAEEEALEELVLEIEEEPVAEVVEEPALEIEDLEEDAFEIDSVEEEVVEEAVIEELEIEAEAEIEDVADVEVADVESEEVEIEEVEAFSLDDDDESFELDTVEEDEFSIESPETEIESAIETEADADSGFELEEVEIDEAAFELEEEAVAEDDSFEIETVEDVEIADVEVEDAELEDAALEDVEIADIELEDVVIEAEPVVSAEEDDLDSFELDEVEVTDEELEDFGITQLEDEPTADTEAVAVEDIDDTDFDIDEIELEIEEEPSADIEPSAEQEPSAEEEPSASEEPSADEEPEAEIEVSLEDELDVELAAESTAALADDLLDADDLELEEIFALEAAEKLDVIDAFVAALGAVSSDLVAAFHTLKGSSAMAEIPSIAAVAEPLEKLANDYLVQNKAADDHLVIAARDCAGLIRTALTDIEANRQAIPGADELLARLASGPAAAEPEVTFDFEHIRLLSQANVAADGWQAVSALIAELKHTDEQAIALNQPALSTLVKAMLRVYESATEKPGEDVLSLMRRAHDALVHMFDSLASSQPVPVANDIIAELAAVDLSAEPAPAEEAAPEIEAAPAAEAAANVVELPADDIDEDIVPIFLEESEELLEELDESILGWTDSGEPGEHLDNLLRQLHTLKGGARMAGINSLGEYAHNFETFLIGIQQNPVEYDDDFFAVLNAQQDEIIRRVEIYRRMSTGGSVSDEELESLKTAVEPVIGAAAAPAPAAAPAAVAEEPASVTAEPAAVVEATVELPADEVDEDILPIFLEESDDLVEELEESIQTWSETPDNMETLDLLLRNLHTLKGGARMAGLNSLGEYAHNFETFLIGIQQNPVTLDDDFFALLNQRQDEVIRRVEIYKKLSVGAATEEELASLTTASEPTLDSAPAAAAEEPAAEAAPAGEDAAKAAPQQAAGAQEPTAVQEMVRVSADLLDELVSLAGESSITRGRVEQQISDFGGSLQEMEETIVRIRDQVRRLEIEAESRETLIRTTTSDDSAFDDLELDRYTMLQEISRALNEATSDMSDLKDTLLNKSRDAETVLHQQARISSELQEGLTRTRMVPFARLIPRLRRIVRQISGEVGKSVRFDAYNVEGELDRNVLERIVAPLEHMLRNAVDHGIEEKDKRVEAGKDEQGRISLRLSREGGYVVLTVSDDGGGIDVNAVRSKAVERGLIVEGQQISNHEVMQFIMHAGFSTAQKLTQISGRGVGMDVVASEIKSLGGNITIDSTLGVGTEFQIRIPFTVSINRALMVVVREETYAVPLNTIEGIVRVSPYELEAYYQPDAPMFEYAGQPYTLSYIGKLLDKVDDPNLAGQVAPLPVILARSGDHAVALQVDRVIGSREVVVKTLGPQFSEVGGISGATVLGDGSVVIILDVMALVRSHEVNRELSGEAPEEVVEPERVSDVRTVMIVDDSVTVRKVTSRLMERQGWEVATAKDGVDAMDQLQEQELRPDVVLLDIEMPKMDGFEVLRSVRRDDNLKDLPIIMITSRTGEKHKEQAMALGVNQYLGKPFQEANLIATIEEVIADAKAKASKKQG